MARRWISRSMAWRRRLRRAEPNRRLNMLESVSICQRCPYSAMGQSFRSVARKNPGATCSPVVGGRPRMGGMTPSTPSRSYRKR